MAGVPARTPLFARHNPGGLFTINNESLNTGNIFWVQSTNTTSGADTVGYGLGPDNPFLTLAFALTQCTAANGDRIYVMEGHAESVIAASTIAWTKSGVSVIGLGDGDLRPTFSWTTILSATMTMSSANCRISNCIFDVTGITALVSGIVVSAAGCVIGGPLPGQGCYFKTSKAGAGTAPLQSILTTAGANRLLIEGNEFIGPALTPTTVAAATSCITLVGGTGIKIKNNAIHGWFTTSVGGIQGLTTLTDNVLIEGNKIGNQTAAATNAITMLTGSTGFIVNNRLGVLTGTAPVVADKCFEGGNVYVATQAVTAGTASTF